MSLFVLVPVQKGKVGALVSMIPPKFVGMMGEGPRLRVVRTPQSDTSELRDEVLVTKFKGGDRRAAEALYFRHARRLSGLVFRLMGGSPDAEDVVQDSFAYAFEQVHELRDCDRFGAWLSQIAVRQAHRRFRRRALERFLGRLPAENVCLISIARADLTPHEALELSRLDEALARLPKKVRTAWLLRNLEGYSVEETADACDCSRATIKRWLATAEERVARRMGTGASS